MQKQNRSRAGLASLTLLLCAACGSDREAPSAQDNRDLDAAGAMLDEAPANLAQVEDDELLEERNSPEAEGR